MTDLAAANLNRPDALRVAPADLQAAWVIFAAGPSTRDQIRALTGANAPRCPARPSRGASSVPTAPLPLPRRAAYA